MGRPSSSSPDGAPEERKDRRFSEKHGSFDVHCPDRVAAGDDKGRERLLRNCAGRPFELKRIEELNDGPVAYGGRRPAAAAPIAS